MGFEIKAIQQLLVIFKNWKYRLRSLHPQWLFKAHMNKAESNLV